MADQVTGTLYCYAEDGTVEEDVDVQLKFSSIVGTGLSVSTAIRTVTSDAEGLCSFTNLFVGATYKIRRGEDKPWKEITVPEDASDPYALTNVWGLDE